MAEEAPAQQPELGTPQGDYQMPSKEEVLKMIDMMDMSDEEKESLRQTLAGGPETTVPAAAAAGVNLEMVILLIMVTMLLSVLFFFGYKLFRSLREREVKREEKRRQKQLRKKK